MGLEKYLDELQLAARMELIPPILHIKILKTPHPLPSFKHSNLESVKVAVRKPIDGALKQKRIFLNSSIF